MLPQDKVNFKNQVFDKIRAELITEVESAAAEMHRVLTAAKEESKSSMGDKYETGRAMAHLELEKLSYQHENKKLMLAALERIQTSLKTTAQPGAVVETSVGLFFICIQAPELSVLKKKVIPISLQSPLGKTLSGCSSGAKFNLNGREIIVNDIY